MKLINNIVEATWCSSGYWTFLVQTFDQRMEGAVVCRVGWSLLMLCCFLYRQETLRHIVSLHPVVEVGAGNILLRVTLQWTWVDHQGGGGGVGGVVLFLVATETRLNSGYIYGRLRFECDFTTKLSLNFQKCRGSLKKISCWGGGGAMDIFWKIYQKLLNLIKY